MKNTPKVILDLCGGSGSWSEPYRLAGYQVEVVSLPGSNVLTYRIPPGIRIQGILSAPPCTHFSLARTTARSPRDFPKALQIVDACLDLVRTARLEHGLKWWALENPYGYLRQFLGKPPFTFNPHDFGDPWTKQTDIWGFFNFPEYKYCRPEMSLEEAVFKLKARAGCLTHKPGSKLSGSDYLAVTPGGFAQAFFKANP